MHVCSQRDIITGTLISSYCNQLLSYNWKITLQRMDDCNCCGKINLNPLKGGMAATASWKNKQPKKKWIQLFLGLKKPAKRKMFFRNNYFLDQHSFLHPVISLSFFVHLLIISAICCFRFYQLIGWQNFLFSCHCSKSKNEKMLYLSLSKIAADILK